MIVRVRSRGRRIFCPRIPHAEARNICILGWGGGGMNDSMPGGWGKDHFMGFFTEYKGTE